MSLPLSSLCGSLTEEDYQSQHASTSLKQRRRQIHKTMSRESSLSVLSTLDQTEDWNNKPSSTRTRRIGGDACFGGLDSLLLMATSAEENHHDQELTVNSTKAQTKHETLKSKPGKQIQTRRIGEGWSNSSLLTATELNEPPDKKKGSSDLFISSLVASPSIEEQKPRNKSSKHVQFGSSILCQFASTGSFDVANDECNVNVSLPVRAASGKGSRINQHPFRKVCDDSDSIVIRKGHALKQAYAVAGKKYPEAPTRLQCGQLRRIEQQESVLLLAPSTNSSDEDSLDQTNQVDDHFLSLFQNQATLNHASQSKVSKPCLSVADPWSKRSMFTSPNLTVRRRTKRRDRKKTPVGKIYFTESVADPKDESPAVKAVSEDQQMEDVALGELDDDTASSLSDESITERWCQSSPVSSSSSPVAMIPPVATSWICEDEKFETAAEHDENSHTDITNSPMHGTVSCETTEISFPMTSHIDDVDTSQTDNVAPIQVVALSEMEETTGDTDCCSTAVLPFIDSKRANSNIVRASFEAVNGMSVDGSCIVCIAPSSSPNDVGQDPEKTTIRRSRRARIATDRYTPNYTQVSDPISEVSSSNPMLKRDRTRSNKQNAEAKPSKSIQVCNNFTAPSRVFPKGTVENNDRKSEFVRTELSSTEINIKNDTTTVDGKPTRERKPTDFFHNHIPPKLQPESSSYSEYTSTEGFRPPKTANSGAFPPLPPNGQITNAIVEDLSTLELNGWTADEIQQLHDAHRQVDPTSSSFWLDVANKIHTRTATECQSQWFSLAKTPAPKSRKIQPKLEYHQEDDDDIFQSTPMRECVFPVSSMSNLPSLNGLRALPPIPLNAKTTTTYNDSGIQEEPGQDRTKPFSKSFLQRMRKDHVKAEKGTNLTQKATKGLHGTKNSHVLSEMIRNNEMDINIRLTPGGTLKVKSHVEDDDFWDEQYEDEDD